MSKLNILILCGGHSTEHHVSIRSACSIFQHLDLKKYTSHLMYIGQDGQWYYCVAHDFFASGPDSLMQNNALHPVLFKLGTSASFFVPSLNQHLYFDCIVPMIHGSNGEDGSLQGLLQLMNMAYVGCDVQSSAIIMDKATTKRIAESIGIPTVPWRLVCAHDFCPSIFSELVEQLGSELFVKAVGLGSSVATACVHTVSEWMQAGSKILRYDQAIVVERRVRAREIECAVLGHYSLPRTAELGEIMVFEGEFYTYSIKYEMPEAARTQVPAQLSIHDATAIKEMSMALFSALRCEGMLRADFFIEQEKIFFNEANTIPGFTSISLYPQMWHVSGLSRTQLLDELIELALHRHQAKQALERVYHPHS